MAQASVPARSARTTSTMQEVQLSRSQMREGVEQLKASGIITEQRRDSDGRLVSTLQLGGGSDVEIAEPTEAESRIWAGSDKYGLWVKFNNWDQSLIIGGGVAAVVTGICFATGPAGCVVASAVGLVAATSLTKYGVCSNNRALKVWVFETKRGAKCV
ncbi:hypothetical protein [Frondihabitans sp. VKM Ac-2883]|uniref:hypothetical protein n=1 Tax=Frondihabitans sp. VKM Ac-2883 TaxID=2783823 RepID=UPI00188D47D7|nr:hypothetical protein [Frondihabitans sp. VKM Ac-2883]MBF4574952.1 hypothetical protein [Frondihabitans sp. VKM Ac-2883]